MNLNDYIAAIDRGDQPPNDLSPLLRALWADRQGDWDRAHMITQDENGRPAARVHAYLHRKEGDLGNARYWYQRSGTPETTGSLESEWKEIAAELLSE